MTRRVRILDDHVANQIAAGEVVERPASVVKELVENALDAGARRVDVQLRSGGKTEIRVADDGSGMDREDALLALDRHATSKISSAEDLAAIASFGFRGEALPSIAAVSRLELETAAQDGLGVRIQVEGGRIRRVDEVARRRGTTVSVRSLFQTVPARAKFLRSASAETRAASEALLLLALSNLAISFRLESNGRELLVLPPASSPRERVAAIWDEERAGGLVAVEHETGDVRVGGLVERPDAARRGGRRHFLFVNGRPFSDPGLVRLVDEAYRTTVAPDVRPWLLLYLALPAGAVDVNVHPAKAEVRFREREVVEGAVRAAVRACLAGLGSAAPLLPGDAEALDSAPAGIVREAAAGSPIGESAPQLALFMRERRDGEPAPEGDAVLDDLVSRRPELWQLHRSYILATTRDGLLIIDQHSAHERILYEEVMARFEAGGADAQRLLFPATLRLAPAEYSAAEELTGLLRKAGFELEGFGDRTMILHAAPNPHPYFQPEECLREMIRELTEGSPLVDSARSQHERIAKSMACKGAIKAGQPLSPDEMAELFDRLFATELPGHDVHGRPTIVSLTLEELGRRFGRT